jgi:DNA-3-methyladenine glycosylase II
VSRRAPSPAHAELAAADPAMAALIARIDPAIIEGRLRERATDRFEALARIVTGQQVSTAAARTVWGRVCEGFGGAPTPEQVAEPDAEATLRAAGLSGRKASYIIGIAQSIVAGELLLEELDEASDEEVMATLVAIRGLGPWSAEMFMLFDLRRPDVFSGGDLGLRYGIRIAYGMDEPPTPAEAIEIAERWRPNRSLASLYLWAAAGEAKTPLPPA